ncbi:hypothetical protein D9M69_447870 [compost metagenome]
MAETARLALLDHQRADQAATELVGAGDMRVVPEAAGILGLEAVVEILAGQHRQLRDVGHAIHLQRQADAVPVDGGRLVELVDEAHPQPVALPATQLDARRLAAIAPGRGDVAGHQLEVERRGDQLVVMGGGILRPPQPIARATDADTDHAEADQAAEHLSAGECHCCVPSLVGGCRRLLDPRVRGDDGGQRNVTASHHRHGESNQLSGDERFSHLKSSQASRQNAAPTP